MKLKLSLVGVALFVTQTFALTPQDIENQIQEIQNLPLQQRVEKMNELKSELRNMNEQEREEVVRYMAERHHIANREMESHMRDGKNHDKMEHQRGDMNRDHMERGDMDRDHMDRDHMDRDHMERDHMDRDHMDRDRD